MSQTLSSEIEKQRKPTYPIHAFLLNRWSPRSMTGEELSDEELLPLFEAARWAPSSYNAQPWRFLYAKRNTPHWKTFFELMIPFNQDWAKHAACLVVVISKKSFDYNNKPARTHSFDTGAAWMSLALEGTQRGYVVHGLEGFDYAKAKDELNISDDYHVEAMIVIGKKAPKENLPEELQKREIPSSRRPLSEIIKEGGYYTNYQK